MQEWPTIPLGEALTFQRGFDITKDEQQDGPYPVFSSSGPKSTHAEFKVRGPGVVIGRKGTLGSVFYSDGDFWPHDTTLWVKDFHANDPKFSFYFLQTMGFERLDAGASNPSLNRNHIHTIPVRWPPNTEQKRIAGILSSYDELIANSQRRIRILETMARAIYREWFVYFRFPGHEAVQRVPSELGEIPKGWEVTKLREMLSLDKGVSYNGAGLTDHGNPLVNLKNIVPGGGFRRDATKPYSGDFKPRHTVEPGDLVVANTDLTQAGNVVASPALIPQLGGVRPILISHHLFAVRPARDVPPQFLYHLMLEDEFRAFAKGYAIGTTVLGLPKEGVLDFSFARPPVSLVAAFTGRVLPLRHLIDILHTRIDTLRHTRGLLLPRLLSGQIRVNPIS